jgi:hypothetical protein
MTERLASNETGPWGPGVTAYEAVTSVVSLHIAQALIDGKSDDVREWATELARELARERIDLRKEIGEHVLRRVLKPLRLENEAPADPTPAVSAREETPP